MAARFFADYGMLAVLAALCAFLSVWTIAEQHPSGAAAAEQLAESILVQAPVGANIAIIARDGPDDKAFAATLAERLIASERTVVLRINGQPHHGAEALQQIARAGIKLDVIAVTKEAGEWAIFDDFDRKYPPSAGALRLWR